VARPKLNVAVERSIGSKICTRTYVGSLESLLRNDAVHGKWSRTHGARRSGKTAFQETGINCVRGAPLNGRADAIPAARAMAQARCTAGSYR